MAMITRDGACLPGGGRGGGAHPGEGVNLSRWICCKVHGDFGPDHFNKSLGLINMIYTGTGLMVAQLRSF